MATAFRCHLLLLPLVPVIFAGAVGFASGDPNSEVHDLLPKLGLPKGLLPDSVVGYSLTGDGDFTVELWAPCYVRFSSIVCYEKTIRGKATYGAISELSGVRAKKHVVWVSINSIKARDNGNIEFKAGSISESLPESDFEAVPVCRKKAVSSGPGGFFPEAQLPAASEVWLGDMVI